MTERYQKAYMTTDQILINYRCWIPHQIKAVVLVIHGLGSHSVYYEEFAEYMAKKNIGVYAIDLRGFGNSKFRLQRIKSFHQFTSDIEQLIKIIKTEFPKTPLFLLGESLGAVIGIEFAALYQNIIKGLILVSPAIIPYVSLRFLFSIIKRICKKSFSDLPNPYLLRKISSDISFLTKIEFDPLYKNQLPFYFGKIMWESQKKSLEYAKRVNLPIMILQSKKDRIIKFKSAKRLYKRVKSSDKCYYIFKKSYHAILNDIEKHQAYDLISKWIIQRV